MACIDHANLAGARQRRRGAGRRFKPYIPGGKRKRKIDGDTLSLASPVPSRGPSITLPSLSLSLFRRSYGGRAQMYEPNEIDARKRADVPARPPVREEARTYYACVSASASVFSTRFITELLMLRDRGEGRARASLSPPPPPMPSPSTTSSSPCRRYFVPSRRASARLRGSLNPQLPRYYDLIYILALTRA